jgi:hypothetical protein
LINMTKLTHLTRLTVTPCHPVLSASKQQIEQYASVLVSAIMAALGDPAPGVREQAGQAFLALHRVIGQAAVQEVESGRMHRWMT